MKCASFKLVGRDVGEGHACFIVAEVAQAHDGSLGMAHAFIDAAAGAGVDAIKFQTHMAHAESTIREPFRVRFSFQDATRYDYWKRMEFTAEQWQGLAQHASDKGLIFLSTPFSPEAVELLKSLDMPAWKMGSGEIGNLPLLEHVVQTGRPVLLSSGMSSWSELDAAVRCVCGRVPLLIYQCATEYPCPPQHVGLPLLQVLRDQYGAPVGLSDHSGKPCFGIAAAALGASSVEVHITLSRQAFGPDVPASLTLPELSAMVEGIRAVEASLRVVPDKDAVADSCSVNRRIFGRSVVAAHPLAVGEVLTRENLALKKPGGGLGPADFVGLLGRRLRRSLNVDELVLFEDLEP